MNVKARYSKVVCFGKNSFVLILGICSADWTLRDKPQTVAHFSKDYWVGNANPDLLANSKTNDHAKCKVLCNFQQAISPAYVLFRKKALFNSNFFLRHVYKSNLINSMPTRAV